MLTTSGIPLIARALEPERQNRTAIVDTEGSYTYRALLESSERAARRLIQAAATVQAISNDLSEMRVAFMVPSGFSHVAIQWGIWRAGGIAVPLCLTHPRPELEHVIRDSGAAILIAHPDFELPKAIARDLGLVFLSTTEALNGQESGQERTRPSLPDVSEDRGALILYTSGTTSKPKGVLTTHRNIAAQVESLITAWEWSKDDAILHFLPLHHIHGVINVLTCALWAGASVRFLPRFDADVVWQALIDEDFTLFMAVPTIYAKLIAAWDQADPERRAEMSAACRKLRLMVSGSAALPVSTLETWRTISGHTLLERYGMTEIGMAISNPLHGERRPGSVGTPLPGVRVFLADESGNPAPPGAPGEIYVKGPGVFREYWGNPKATADAFRDGWFRTGDVAALEDGYYRILGRASVDIIKTGGYKVSALEIEEVLRTHPAVAECAVVGTPDPEWGERVSAAVILKAGNTLTLDALRAWAKERMAVYKVPTRLQIVDDLPRNAMGKVTKPEVAASFAQSPTSA